MSVKARKAARGWLTRASNRLGELCENPEVDIHQLRDAIDEFDQRLSKLDSIQGDVEVELEDDQLTQDIENSADFRDKARIPRIKATKILLEKDNKQSSLSGSIHSHVETAKLPKLKLPHFSGDPLAWTTFWEQFEVVVHNTDMPDVTKFSYLRSLLTGEALATVQGLSLTGSHYKIACDLLKNRFGRTERIIFSHVQELLSINMPKQTKVSVMWEVYNNLQAHVRSLDSLGVSGREYGVVLTPLILSRLPPDMRLEWARGGENHESDLEWLLKFFKQELERRERSQTFNQNITSVNVEVKRSSPVQPSVAALHTSTFSDNTSVQSACPLCGRRNHPIWKCYNLTKAPVSERKQLLRAANVCFKCLKTDHNFRTCDAKCSKCQDRHHLLLCEIGRATGSKIESHIKSNINSNETDVKSNDIGMSHTGVSCASVTRSSVLLQTARVKLHGKRRTVDAVVLFDTGSDKSYVSSRVVDMINPEWVKTESIAYSAFGSANLSRAELRNVYNVCLQGGNGKSETILATEIPVICSTLFCPLIPNDSLTILGSDLDIVSVCAGQEVAVDILVGLDCYWRLITPEIVNLSAGLVAQRTVFGWIVSGIKPEDNQVTASAVSHQLFCSSSLSEFSEREIRNFWELESIGINSCESVVSDHVLDEFQKNVSYSGGRYEVALPWKSEVSKLHLLNNEKIARQRFEYLSSKLAKNPELESQYHKVLHEYWLNGFIEEVSDNESHGSKPIYYMPHRPVVNMAKQTTKVRPVFDASAKGFNDISLNDCLDTGPSLIPNLPGILIRFRRWLVALCADVRKAFLQIQVRPEDRNVHRFFWDDHGTVRVMRFVRVPFGNKSSPFLLNATVKYHLAKFSPTKVVEELSQNLYVDDFLSGCDDDSKGVDMIHEANDIMDKASFSLAKWASNSQSVGDVLNHEFHDRSSLEESLKVLGLRWVAKEDYFCFDGIVIPSDLCVTKRMVLSFISRLFDPLGLLTPFIIVAKCLFQRLWCKGFGWDEVLPDEFKFQFLRWIEGHKVIRQWKIPRCYTSGRWNDVVMFQLHAFGDASEVAYGACVYLKVKLQDGSCETCLVYGKAKVAPLKRITLPRLELLGALLCVRLLVYVREALKLPKNVYYNCWTDSTVALAWIQSDPCKWKTFVSNRVFEIQGLTSPSQWRHCPGKQNPADLVTRGISAEELIKSDLWLHGPEFLLEDQKPDVESFSMVSDSVVVDSFQSEAICSSSIISIQKNSEPFLNCERWSSFCKAIRIVAWILRFVHNVQSSNNCTKGDLTLKEMCKAKVFLLSNVQKHEFVDDFNCLVNGQSVLRKSPLFKLNPFLDKDGLLRVKGRLQFSGLPYESKHPLILPKCRLSLLIVHHIHKTMKHAGVNAMLVRLRDEYWVLGARRLCKRVKRECLSCQRQDVTAGEQITPPLPEMRVTQAPAFSVTGIDHGGPLFCCDSGNKKFYVLLFTCAVIRAVHLELVDSLSAQTTLAALRRFVSRRGMPAIIMSDNARGFVAAKDLTLKFFGTDGPEWKFIAPRAPWWGGWWERLIKSVKSALKRTVGKRSLSHVELETVLHEIEACVNSRPLTFVSDDIELAVPLTPAHFLIGRPLGSPSVKVVSESSVSSKNLIDRFQLQNQVLEQFWNCWSSEYIRNLPLCRNFIGSKGSLKVGSVVLVKGEGHARLSWPIGRIQKVFPGHDGLVRTVEVKTAKGVFIRPIQCVYDLEINEHTDDAVISACPSSVSTYTEPIVNVLRSRYGRIIKHPQRLDL